MMNDVAKTDGFQAWLSQADDTVTTSTSVFVAEPGSVSAVGLYSSCSGTGCSLNIVFFP